MESLKKPARKPGVPNLDARLSHRDSADREGVHDPVALTRRRIRKALTGTRDEILDYEAVSGTMSAHTQDGTRAFVEKRKPQFQGH